MADSRDQFLSVPGMFWTSQVALVIKNPPANAGDMRHRFNPWAGKILWEEEMAPPWQPTPVFLPGESPWAEDIGGLQSIGSQRVGHD